MKHWYVRSDEDLEDDEEQLVRGGRLNPETIRVDARRMHDIYGVFGISVFFSSGDNRRRTGSTESARSIQ